jgi:PAS domain S-box-containing protein
MRWNAHAIYTICNRSLEELLHEARVADPVSVRIEKARTLGEIEYFGRRNDLAILVYTETPLQTLLAYKAPPDLPDTFPAGEAGNQVHPHRIAGEKYYAYHFDFDPWQWHLVIFKKAAFYASLENAILRTYAAIGVLLLSSLLIIALINQWVKQPLNRIVRHLKEEKLPRYKGIEEFEFLSDTISEMMAAIKDKNAWIQRLISTVGAMIIVSDARGRIVLVNRKWEETTGQAREEILGRFLWDIFSFDAMGDLIRQYLQDPVRHQDKISFESTLYRKDGEPVAVLWNNSTILDDRGDVKWFIGTGIDITARKRAEEDRRKLEQQLRQSQKMEAVGTLAGGVAHEFNNMLQGISGHVQLLLLKKSADDPDQPSLLAIDRTAVKAAEMVRRLLTFSRKVKVNLLPVDLNEIIGNTVRALRRGLPDTIAIETDLDKPLPAILADHFQMEQVLINLAHNGVDAMKPNGGGTLRFSTTSVWLTGSDGEAGTDLAAGPYVLLEVADTGAGMCPDTVKHIFDPFFTTKEIGKGTGLGLSIVYGIIAENKGAITCSSVPGRGTTFRVHLPVKEDDTAGAIGTETPSPRQGASAPPSENP